MFFFLIYKKQTWWQGYSRLTLHQRRGQVWPFGTLSSEHCRTTHSWVNQGTVFLLPREIHEKLWLQPKMYDKHGINTNGINFILKHQWCMMYFLEANQRFLFALEVKWPSRWQYHTWKKTCKLTSMTKEVTEECHCCRWYIFDLTSQPHRSTVA